MAFVSLFQRSFSATFDRRAAAAAAAPWWLAGGAPTPIAVYQPKGAASLAASYVNLANPGTYDAAPGVAPTWASATGWTFAAASSQYLATGVTATTTAWSIIVSFSNASQATAYRVLCGYYISAASGFAIFPLGNNVNCYFSNGTENAFGSAVSSGVVGMAGKGCYVNGNLRGTLSAGGASNGRSITIGGDAVGGRYMSANVLSLAIYSATLTAGEVAAVSAAMAAL